VLVVMIQARLSVIDTPAPAASADVPFSTLASEELSVLEQASAPALDRSNGKKESQGLHECIQELLR
jgi:hypothetical protein